jgi:hypothetical protein
MRSDSELLSAVDEINRLTDELGRQVNEDAPTPELLSALEREVACLGERLTDAGEPVRNALEIAIKTLRTAEVNASRILHELTGELDLSIQGQRSARAYNMTAIGTETT